MSEIGTILMSLLALALFLLLFNIRTALSDKARKEASLLDQLQEKDRRIAELEDTLAMYLSGQAWVRCKKPSDASAVYRASAVFTDEPD